jgi:molybdopterin/thiamine biosynthesis adenylyltransferase
MNYSLTIREDHFEELCSLILNEDGRERPAILLCRAAQINNSIWGQVAETRYLSREVLPIPDSHIIEHSENRVTWNTQEFRKVLKRAKDEDLQVCLVHSHPQEALFFSDYDDESERELFETLYNRNGGETPNLSLIITQDRQVISRVCDRELTHSPISLIRILGNKFTFHYPSKFSFLVPEEFNRQQLAFGPSLNADFAKLKIGIVGCGATGSATAHLLARLGVQNLLLIDIDNVEASNLSRLFGANASDVGKRKVETLANFISAIGIGSNVRTISTYVDSGEGKDAIKSCDIIFGCTDDNSGRVMLNRFAYFYLTPVIDMGIVIEPSETQPDLLQTLQGRFSVLQPHTTCLICRNVIDRTLAREEDLKRNDPDGYERQKKEAYVIGSGNPSPAVITFTSEVASMSVNELINRIIGFKKVGAENHVIRFFNQSVDRKPVIHPDADCPICSDRFYWGLGDVSPFLDQVN